MKKYTRFCLIFILALSFDVNASLVRYVMDAEITSSINPLIPQGSYLDAAFFSFEDNLLNPEGFTLVPWKKMVLFVFKVGPAEVSTNNITNKICIDGGIPCGLLFFGEELQSIVGQALIPDDPMIPHWTMRIQNTCSPGFACPDALFQSTTIEDHHLRRIAASGFVSFSQVSSIPIPPAAILFISALALLGIFRSNRHRR